MPALEEEVSSEFGDYTFKLERTEDKLTVKRSFKFKEFNLPPERYADLKAFYKEIDRCGNVKLVLVKKKT